MCKNKFMLTLITLAPVCIIYDAHNAALGGTGGCYIFIEINVKRQSNPGPSKYAPQRKFSPAKLFQNMILKSVHHFDSTAGV